METKKLPTLIIVAGAPKSGTTTTTANLARALAESGKKCIILSVVKPAGLAAIFPNQSHSPRIAWAPAFVAGNSVFSPLMLMLGGCVDYSTPGVRATNKNVIMEAPDFILFDCGDSCQEIELTEAIQANLPNAIVMGVVTAPYIAENAFSKLPLSQLAQCPPGEWQVERGPWSDDLILIPETALPPGVENVSKHIYTENKIIYNQLVSWVNLIVKVTLFNRLPSGAMFNPKK